MKPTRALCLCAALWLLALLPAAVAAPGDLDASFGTGGVARSASGTTSNSFEAVAVQADGRIVAGGSRTTAGPFHSAVLSRFNADGSVDATFGGTGIVVTFSGGGGGGANITDVAIQDDGKIVAVGSFFNNVTNVGAVVRYLPDGTLDASFAGGIVTAAFAPNTFCSSVALQGDGKIVVAGHASNQPFVARYQDDGTLDPGFNGTGSVTASIGDAALATGVVIQGDGKIVIGGYATFSANNDFLIARFNDDGTPDTGFNGSGVATFDFGGQRDEANDIVLQPDGRIILAGDTSDGTSADYDQALVRCNADGTLDTSFGGSGMVTTDFLGLEDRGYGVALQTNGRIVVSGQASDAGGPKLAFACYRSDGTLQAAFAGGGKVRSEIGMASSGFAVAVQSDNRIVVAGYANDLGSEAIVARFDGTVPGDVDGLDASVVGIDVLATAVQPDGKIIIAGSFAQVLGVPRNRIARLNADGTLDMGFDPFPFGGVYSVAVLPDGKVLIGGEFTNLQPNGAPAPTERNRIARLNADGTLDTSFNPNADSGVYSVAVQADGKVLIGGAFTALQPTGTVAPIPRNGIARLNEDGTLDAGFDPNVTGSVHMIAVQADGKVLLSGSFTALQPNGAPSPTPRNSIARVNPDGTLDVGFDPNINGIVYGMAVQADGKVLIGGDFTTLQPSGAPSPTTRNRIARLNPDGTLDTIFDPNANNLVLCATVQADGKVLVGGHFTTLQPNGAASPTTRNRIARLNPDGTLDTSFDPNADQEVSSVAIHADGKVLLAGDFLTLQPNGAGSPATRNGFARLANDPATQTLTAPNLTQALWQRTGAGPELSEVAFELSRDGGASWMPLGDGTRIGSTSDWQLVGLSLPSMGWLLARGRAQSGSIDGNASSLIEQVAVFGGSVVGSINTGGTATAPDLPGTTTFVSFTAPEIGVSGGRIRTEDGRTLDAVFNEQGEVLLHGEQVVSIDPDGGGAMGTIAKLMPPTGDAVLATLVRGAGVTAENDQVLFTGLQGDDPQPVVRKGQEIPNLLGIFLKAFVTLDGNGETTFFSGKLKGPGMTETNNTALFAVGPAGFTLLARQGMELGDDEEVKTIATLVGQAGSLAEGRWRGGPDFIGARITTKKGRQMLYLIPADAEGPDDWLLIASSGDDAAPDLPGAKLQSFKLPAFAPEAVVFDSLLQKGVGGITRRNNRAVFDVLGVDMGGPITLRLLAQVAGPAPALSGIQRFRNTLAGLGRASTVIADATLPGLRGSRTTIFDARQDGVLRAIARLGDVAPGGGRFDRFVSVAKPDGQGYGALVSALLRVSGREGVTPKNRKALFGVDSKGDMIRLLRAGDQLESAGPGSARKVVRSFVALAAAPGSIGAARGYSDDGRVNVLVTFADRTQAVVSIQVP